ncbi:hypothetical protein AAC03nite_07570 [Alicyclobacillus acidoterrestris]|uniref:chorismate mutase n=1 Tax=Alicyclobacillus suci TaxID=2816080 RepID=UPI0011921777|nr:chorismate mutase [Alicyclobacillus suci]GEO24972.1 hypothetical protein AAC03nite_07570 [Alicyclobacillus acidoterrestris]
MDDTICSLDEFRAKIDSIDHQLITCLAKRFELSKTIGTIKRSKNVDVYQPDRANQVQQRFLHLGALHGMQERFVTHLFELIHEESCRVQRTEV